MPGTGSDMKILRHSTLDAGPVFAGVLYLSLIVFVAATFDRLTNVERIAAAGVTFMASISALYAYHFHQHTPFFVSKTLNDLLNIVYSMAFGFPLSFHTVVHFLHHDPEVLKTQREYTDDGLAMGWIKHSGIAQSLLYLKHADFLELKWVAWAIFYGRSELGTYSGGAPVAKAGASAEGGNAPWIVKKDERISYQPRHLWQPTQIVAQWLDLARRKNRRTFVVVECASVFAFRVGLLVWNPRFFLAYFVFNFLVALFNNYTDFVDHWGADLDHVETNAVSSYGRLFNLFTFNNGYHHEHHTRPGVHWTKLARVRAELLPDSCRRVVPGSLWLNTLVPLRPLVTTSSVLVVGGRRRTDSPQMLGAAMLAETLATDAILPEDVAKTASWIVSRRTEFTFREAAKELSVADEWLVEHLERLRKTGMLELRFGDKPKGNRRKPLSVGAHAEASGAADGPVLS
jgi:fatty acid desaturase